MKPKVAILLSSYNGGEYISEQIESILNQSYKNITLLIRDDGSTDKTISIIQSYLNNHKNIIFLKGENIGLVRSFLELLRYAFSKNFDYFAFCDQDDIWLPNKISSAVDCLDKYSNEGFTPLLYSCTSKVVDKNLKFTGKLTEKKTKEITFFNTAIQNICPGHNQVINRPLAKIVLDLFKNNNYIYSQDYWITNIAVVTGKICFDNIPHTLYRMHNDNQLGYGSSKLGRFINHITRVKNKEARKMAIQLNDFVRLLYSTLSMKEKNEMSLFFDSQSSFIKRANYIRYTKLYRQNNKETLAFKILYLLGFYNLPINYKK